MVAEHPNFQNQIGKGRFGVAMPFLLGKSTFYLPLCPIRTYREIAEQAGINLDYWPIRPIPNAQARLGLVTSADASVIKSASGSYRSEKKLIETLKHPNLGLSVKSRLLLPYRDNLKAVRDTSHSVLSATGEIIPVVVYPETPNTILEISGIFVRIVQPTPENFTKARIKSLKDLETYLKTHSVHGFCFDTLHSRFLYGTDLFDPVMASTHLVHLSLGRSDVTRPNHPVDGMQELLDVLQNRRGSKIFSLLKSIRDTGFKGVYVFETPVEALEIATGLAMTRHNLTIVYRRLAENLSLLT